MPIALRVNGEARALDFDTRTSLLDALRDHLGLTGSKKGCNHGQCGACTVLLDGRRVNACLVLAVSADGAAVTTVDGLAPVPDPVDAAGLHPVQAAFLEHDAYQCGYCTPGQMFRPRPGWRWAGNVEAVARGRGGSGAGRSGAGAGPLQGSGRDPAAGRQGIRA